MNKSKDNFKEEAVFKVPELRVIKKPVARKPISSGLVGRRSLRILLKRSNDDFVEDSSCDHIEDDMSLSDISDIDKSKFNESHYEKKRHRVRLPKKIESKDRYLNTSSREKYNNSLDDFDLEATAEVINKHASGRNAKMPEFSNKKRKSCRLNKATNSLTKDKVTTNIHHTDLLKATPAVKKIWNSKAR